MYIYTYTYIYKNIYIIYRYISAHIHTYIHIYKQTCWLCCDLWRPRSWTATQGNLAGLLKELWIPRLTSVSSNLEAPKLPSPPSQSGEVSAALKPAAPIVYLGLERGIRRYGGLGMSSRELSPV